MSTSRAAARFGAQYWACPFGPITRAYPPMPKLSSADTPPEKSSDCLPVRTIAEAGVITRMPLVCMSMVASAFQYGWAPTLMPATTMLISPPALGELDDAPQRAGDPVHVLGAGVHGDARAG